MSAGQESDVPENGTHTVAEARHEKHPFVKINKNIYCDHLQAWSNQQNGQAVNPTQPWQESRGKECKIIQLKID